ncbi:MAG: hypothetical protein Q8R37_04185, partial [Nanoarchaeota archaeon]|nr:hypothetical protein [Nanoarchaeota archaeon]
MVHEKPNIYHFLQRYFSDRSGLGMKAVLILDTSAIIELETASRKQYGVNQAHEFLDTLHRTAPEGVEFIVSEGVKKEVKYHAKCHIGCKPEISPLTSNRILEVPEDKNLLHFMVDKKERIDAARYLLRLLYHSKMGGKKKDTDPISRNDWQIIDTAIAAGIYSEAQFERNKLINPTRPFDDCYRAAILSGDKHIYWTIAKSAEEPEGI